MSVESDLEKGIQLVVDKRYEDALDVLSEANKETPNDALTNLWLGLAYQGAKQPHEAMAAWRVSFGNPKWEPIADTLRGYGWWALGDTRYAELTFKEALVNLRDSKVIRFKPATDGLVALAGGAPVPSVAKWIERVGLVEATKKALNPEAAAPEEAEKPVERPRAEPPKEAEPKAPKGVNVKPVAGKWIAKRTSGGYNDGKILFTVSADGKRITDVVFIGHWYDRERRRTEPVTTGPEKPYAITSGGWGGLQTNSKAGFGWEFSGRLTSARSAVGSFRGYAAGVYDTGTVQWKATPAK
ncbi:tetratricopeptide repeat protein [bacterium]|nr:MAG: tetratricopeptide repeat protein [bacterium]